MSGIARNTLRLIGTAKYLRTMKPTTNGLNNSLALLQSQYFNHNGSTQGKQMSTTFESTLLVAKEKVLSLFDYYFKNKVTVETEEVKEAKTGLLKVSLSNGKLKFITPHRDEESYILHPTFNMQLNGKSIEPESDKTTDPNEKASFYFYKWHVSRDGDKFILRVKDSDETFIVKHAVNIIAHEKPCGENGDCNVTSGKIIFDLSMLAAKMISKTDSSEILERSFEPVKKTLFKRPVTPDEITDGPNRQGKIKLKYPMTVSLEGAPQIIKMRDSNNYYTVNHTIDVQAYKRLPENGNNNVETKDTSKVDVLLMKLEGGDVIIEPIAPSDQCVILQQEAGIKIDLTNEVPFIQFYPTVRKRNRSALK